MYSEVLLGFAGLVCIPAMWNPFPTVIRALQDMIERVTVSVVRSDARASGCKPIIERADHTAVHLGVQLQSFIAYVSTLIASSVL
ncbi:hypothetical protein Tco_1420293 [Tanacetum coccineum]